MHKENYPIEYLKIFSNFFNRNQILNYINKNETDLIKYLIESDGNTGLLSTFKDKTYGELYDYLYEQMKVKYRCEYVYLNEIFFNCLLKNHDEVHKILTEVHVDNSQADLVVINGTTTIYEIKTELDSLVRLEKQLESYIKVFDRVYVITYSKMYNKIKEFIDEKFPTVGIGILSKKGTLYIKKKSRSHISFFCKNTMFSMLHKKEKEILDPTMEKAYNKFISFSNQEAHTYFRDSFFQRGKDTSVLEDIPYSLKIAAYKIQDRLTQKQKNRFMNKINIKIGEDL